GLAGRWPIKWPTSRPLLTVGLATRRPWAEPGAAADRPREERFSELPRFLPREPAAFLNNARGISVGMPAPWVRMAIARLRPAPQTEFRRSGPTRGCRCNCVALRKGGANTCRSASSLLPRRASLATGRCGALGTTYPHPSGWPPRRESERRLPAPR